MQKQRTSLLLFGVFWLFSVFLMRAHTLDITITTTKHTPPYHVPQIAYDTITGEEYIEVDEACYTTPNALAFYLSILSHDITLIRRVDDPMFEHMLAIQLASYLHALQWFGAQDTPTRHAIKKELIAIHDLNTLYLIEQYERAVLHKDAVRVILPDIQKFLIERYHGDYTIQVMMPLASSLCLLMPQSL